jgi:hypothetical protein
MLKWGGIRGLTCNKAQQQRDEKDHRTLQSDIFPVKIKP